jgi:GNAT superfamily N-acetyltransferase
VGSALLAAVREDADRLGADVIELTAVTANASALRFYEREGFTAAFTVLRDIRRRP